MTLQRREKILAYITGGLLVVMLAWFLLWAGDAGPVSKLLADRVRLEAEIEAKQAVQEATRREAQRLVEWRRRALPSDPDIAQALYGDWLRGLANRTNIRDLTITSLEPNSKANVYTRISFVLAGHATLASLTEFLYEFYSVGHLHQIRQMEIKPQSERSQLNIKLTIEAMSLTTADRKEELSKESGRGLQGAALADYRGPITTRNMFLPYTPPPPPAPPEPPPAPPPPPPVVVAAPAKPTVDVALHAFITGFVEVDGVRQVWLQERIAGRTHKLKEGEEFQIGDAPGKVRTIAPKREVVLEFDGRVRRLQGGDNLRGGVELEELKKAEAKTEEVKTEEVKTEEVKTEEVKTEEVKAEEGKAEEGKAEEGKAEEGKTAETKVESHGG